MITGAHAMVFARDAEAARAFFAFALPPAELACHPAAPRDSGRHALLGLYEPAHPTPLSDT
ncbi:MAG TPA: hypothetical protein VFY32_08455 [Solirubrobacteraceae bacterium]|nr:hypothetical protein [Solirubrobacteraceae bacterium]